MKDVKADGRVCVEVKVIESMPVEEDMRLAWAGNVECCGLRQRMDTEVGAEVVRIHAKIRAVPRKLVVVGTASSDITLRPDVLLGEGNVIRRSRRNGARRIERTWQFLRARSRQHCDGGNEDREKSAELWHDRSATNGIANSKPVAYKEELFRREGEQICSNRW
jgi:hypothetical protein